MKIVVDIGEEAYEEMKERARRFNCVSLSEYLIATGSPLPDDEVEIIEKESLKNIRAEVENVKNNPLFNMVSNEVIHEVILEIIDKHLEKEEE